MKQISRRPALNPAFKRFQYLPHVPTGTAAKRECAAPLAGAPRRVSDANSPSDAQFDRLSPHFTGAVSQRPPSNWEFQSPA